MLACLYILMETWQKRNMVHSRIKPWIKLTKKEKEHTDTSMYFYFNVECYWRLACVHLQHNFWHIVIDAACLIELFVSFTLTFSSVCWWTAAVYLYCVCVCSQRWAPCGVCGEPGSRCGSGSSPEVSGLLGDAAAGFKSAASSDSPW